MPLNLRRRAVVADPAVRYQLPPSAEEQAILARARPLTMTSEARLLAVIDAVTHLVRRDIPGALVECGVWKGGSVVAMLMRLLQLGVTDREVYLYDTFEGMTAPTAADTSAFEAPALTTWNQALAAGRRAWQQLFAESSFSEAGVREALTATGYPMARVHLVRGPVELTLPAQAPGPIALLRLDTDWYESTRHELEQLYPALSAGGVLIVDDYGHWEGCRRAVDEYFARPGMAPLLLQRTDYTGRMAVKA